MTCHCPQCSQEPKPTYTEEFKMRCLSRAICKLDDKTRISIFQKYKEKMGKKFELIFIDEVSKKSSNRGLFD